MREIGKIYPSKDNDVGCSKSERRETIQDTTTCKIGLCGFVNIFTSLCIMTNLYVFLTVLWTLIHAQLNLVQTMESVSNLLVEALDAPAPQNGLENAVICVSCASLCDVRTMI